jgi:uncharacterized protein (TIGR04255 family)
VPRPADEPDYGRPPIDEVAIGIYFEPLPGFIEAHAGLFWKTVKDTYPTAQAQPRLETGWEMLQDPPAFIAPTLHVMTGLPGRTWLISTDDSYVLQVQDNFFIRNWRKREAPYPHFDVLHQEYWADFSRFKELLMAEGLAEPTLRQLEVAYINWIPDLPFADFFGPASQANVAASMIDPQPEAQAWTSRYVVRENHAPRGRIYAQCQPSARALPDGILTGAQFSLVFRAPLNEASDNDEAHHLFELGSRAIVQMFTQLTTPEAHKHWDRIQ